MVSGRRPTSRHGSKLELPNHGRGGRCVELLDATSDPLPGTRRELFLRANSPSNILAIDINFNRVAVVAVRHEPGLRLANLYADLKLGIVSRFHVHVASLGISRDVIVSRIRVMVLGHFLVVNPHGNRYAELVDDGHDRERRSGVGSLYTAGTR